MVAKGWEFWMRPVLFDYLLEARQSHVLHLSFEVKVNLQQFDIRKNPHPHLCLREVLIKHTLHNRPLFQIFVYINLNFELEYILVRSSANNYE